jgi:hypothetical protein
MGVPLVQGVFTITVHAVDANGLIANNRANTAPDQSLVLTVGANSISSSDLTTLSCSVRGDRAGGGKDNLRYVGIVNALGQDKFSLADSDFAFRLANIAVTGRLDSNGSFKGDLADGSSAKVKISSSGILSVMISKGSFSTALNAAALVDGKLTREILQVTVGDAVVSSEALDFDTSVRDTRYTLNYALGRSGASAGGGFQIVSVRGKDDLSSGGLTGDSWRVGFIALAPKGITANGTPGLDNVTAVNIRIGTNFIQNLTPIKSRGANTRFSLRTPDGVTRFSLSGKNGKGTLQTDTLATRITGIPQAIASSGFGNLFFPLGVDITRTGAPFTGEHARRIFGLGKNYKDQAPKR